MALFPQKIMTSAMILILDGDVPRRPSYKFTFHSFLGLLECDAMWQTLMLEIKV